MTEEDEYRGTGICYLKSVRGCRQTFIQLYEDLLEGLSTTYCRAVPFTVPFYPSHAQAQMYTRSIFQYYIITQLKYLGICGRFLSLSVSGET